MLFLLHFCLQDGVSHLAILPVPEQSQRTFDYIPGQEMEGFSIPCLQAFLSE